MEYPAQLITSIIGPLYSRLREYCGRGFEKILRFRGPRQDFYFKTVSYIYKRKAALRKSQKYDCLNKTHTDTYGEILIRLHPLN